MLKNKKLLWTFMVAGIGALFGLGFASLAFLKLTKFNVMANNQVLAQEKVLSDEEEDLMMRFQSAFNKVAQQVMPSVVRIDVISVQKRPQAISPWDFFFQQEPPTDSGQEKEYKSGSLGSGFVIEREGNTLYILTNHHVVDKATTVSVEFNDGRRFDAKVLGFDKRKDIAMVAVEVTEKDSDIKPLKLANSDNNKVGDWVLAVGSPFGFDFSVTTGIISAIGRTGGPNGNINDFIQTDTAINQGNSGGPLFNIKGEVVGVNDWIATQSGGSIGLSFSIPINNVKVAIDDMKAGKEPSYGWMGVTIIDVKTLGGQDYATSAGFKQTKGAIVLDVFKGSPADKGGIKPGDLVLSINGTAVESSDRLVYMIGGIMAGQEASFEIIRDGKPVTLSVKVDVRKDDKILEDLKDSWPAMIVMALTDDIKKELKVSNKINGVLIAKVDPKTRMSIAGFKAGDIIQKVNKANILSVQDYFRAINADGNKFTFTFNREGQELEITVKK